MISHELQQKIRQIQITASKAVSDVLAGEYHSVFKGRGMEFDEVRLYQPGDDVRTIDWNVTARTGEPHIKRYVEERELTILFLVDLSASGAFGSADRLKNDIAAELCGLLAFAAIRNNDKAGLIAFSDDIELFIPPKKGTSHALRLVRDILHIQPKGRKTDINTVLNYVARVQNKRAVIFLISDFRAPDFSKTLRATARRHDVIAISITDPAELALPKAGLLRLVDNESGKVEIIDTSNSTVRRRFQTLAADRRQGLARLFKKQAIDHIPLVTDDDYVVDLVRFFRARERRRVH
ncbi:MAG: DUF58 domain-containing protein [Proteobacteria bacterium]|nr:DUF58 domain-containing protein [Pseudomonadota bacterium]MBU1639742.1 DUF58 domain-containing protein [Pseudomonadota bacterium]